MNSTSTDPELAKSRDALIRAGQRAREMAARTGTPLVTWRDGKIHKEIPPMHVRLKDSPIIESEEVAPGAVLDYNEQNEVVGVEFCPQSLKGGVTVLLDGNFPLTSN